MSTIERKSRSIKCKVGTVNRKVSPIKGKMCAINRDASRKTCVDRSFDKVKFIDIGNFCKLHQKQLGNSINQISYKYCY